MDWVQVVWSAAFLVGISLLQYYRGAGDPVQFDEGTSPP